MIIDVHTHIYPDKIAGKIEIAMKERGMHLCGPMTLGGLKDHMRTCGIAAAITFCLAEKPSVVKPANDFLIGVNDSRTIHGFGTVLPDVEDPRAEVRRLKKGGIKGIKFNPIFQEAGACDPAMFPIYEEMGGDMVAFFHSGVDPFDPGKPARVTPERLAKLKGLFPKLKIVAAHLGGHDMLDDVKKWILGKDIYIDTSWTPDIMAVAPDTFMQIVKGHGIRRVLFGTDYPEVSNPKAEIEWIMRRPLTEQEKARLFHENAAELLKDR